MRIPPILTLLLVALAFVACSKRNKTMKDDDSPKVGGVYANKSEDGAYRITKVLVVDQFAVHIRMYADKFDALPPTIDTSKLKFLIGHAPLAREAFTREPGMLLKVETVSESELEGYRLYLEAMKGSHP
jgi:hypothetical protein